MDWDTQYELMKAGRAVPVAGPSYTGRNAPIDNDGDEGDIPIGLPPRDREEEVGRRRAELFADEEETVLTPLERLTRHWMNERHAPDILPAQEDLLMSLLDHLRRQVRLVWSALESEAVQLLREDPSTSEEEHIRIILVQTEVERVKFIVRSYVRTRLFKIEKYARFITTNADVQRRLTAAELDHASRHAKITDQHFYVSVLQGLPEKQSHLDDTPLFVPPMITEPDKSRPVFVHALKQCPRIRLPDGATLEMEKGHISLLPYSVVDQLVARGEVELI